MVHEPVDRRDRDGGVGEDLAPFAERLVAGDDQRAALAALGDQLEQHAGLGLVFADVTEIVEDQTIELVEFGEGRRQGEIPPRGLQFLDEIGGAGEHHAIAVVDQSGADRCGSMRLSRAAWPEYQDVGALFDPGIAGSKCRQMRLAQVRRGSEVEARQRFAGRQVGLGQMTGDPPRCPLGKFVLAQRGEKARRAPALPIRLRAELLPKPADRR